MALVIIFVKILIRQMLRNTLKYIEQIFCYLFCLKNDTPKELRKYFYDFSVKAIRPMSCSSLLLLTQVYMCTSLGWGRGVTDMLVTTSKQGRFKNLLHFDLGVSQNWKCFSLSGLYVTCINFGLSEKINTH